MGFRAEDQKMRDCASLLQENSFNSFTAADYARTSVTLESEAGVAFSQVADRHKEAVEAIDSSFSHLVSLLARSAEEINESANLYKSIDSTQAEELDRLYPS